MHTGLSVTISLLSGAATCTCHTCTAELEIYHHHTCSLQRNFYFVQIHVDLHVKILPYMYAKMKTYDDYMSVMTCTCAY